MRPSIQDPLALPAPLHLVPNPLQRTNYLPLPPKHQIPSLLEVGLSHCHPVPMLVCWSWSFSFHLWPLACDRI